MDANILVKPDIVDGTFQSKTWPNISKTKDFTELGFIFQKFSLKVIINFRIPFIENSLSVFAPVTWEGGGST
jgi:hypothetical protein